MRAEEWEPEDEGPETENDAVSELDLILENQALEQDLKIAGMSSSYKAEDLDPAVENQFLKNIKMFEEMEKEPKGTLAGLFPDGSIFPSADAMSDEAVRAMLEAIEAVLASHQIYFGFANELPDRLVYQHFVNELLPEEEEIVYPNPPAGFSYTLDGCTGCCEECFQLAFCETGKDIIENGPWQPEDDAAEPSADERSADEPEGSAGTGDGRG